MTLFEGEQTDISAGQYAYFDRGFVHEFQYRSLTFYTSRRWHRTPKDLAKVTADADDTPFVLVPVPDDHSFSTFGDAATIELRKDWTPVKGGATHLAGSLLSAPLAAVMAGDFCALVVLFAPTASTSLESQSGTKDYLVLKVMEDVRAVLKFWKYEGGGKWSDATPAGGGAVAPGEDVSVSAVWPDASNELWLYRDGYLVPDSMDLTNAEDSCASTEPLKSKPSMFNAEDLTVDQHFAASLDGTKIPYFVMRKKELKYDSSNAVLLDA